MFKRVIRWLKKPLATSIVHLGLIIAAVTYNYFMQVFCVPSPWATVLIIGIAVFLITKPWHPKAKFPVWQGIMDAVAVMTSLYCILFLAEANFLGLIMAFTGLGSLIYVPHYFFLYTLWPYFKSKVPSVQTKSLKITTLILGLFSLTAVADYTYESYRIKSALADKSKPYPSSWMAEKITGMHFKYHTQLDYYDGWRPPIHEPLLVLGYQLSGFRDPINLGLKERLSLYREHFPNEPFKLECSCAKAGRIEYHRDALWE